MNTPRLPACPKCGVSLPVDAPKGLCPRCLAAMNFATETVLTGADALAAKPPLSPAELAPHFPQLEIIECLGRGGMGVVYKARQKSLNRVVALKLLAPERVSDATFAKRFTHEAQALAALNHPSIVTIYDFGQAGGFYFLLMEFVDGVNLRQAMKAGRFTPEQALAVVPPVCEALQYAHEHGIVHRDIKPENLLLDKDGRVKIADFGIAKMLHTDATDASLADSQPAGTPQYMAPEQKAHRSTDHRADIYSLGVVLYELLTGELPANKLQPPSRKVQIDVRLDEIVLRALESKPELRFQTAGEFRTRVEAVTQNLDRTAPIPVKQITGILTTPERVRTYRGQLSLFANRGPLALDDQQITHQSEGVETCIPLAAIKDVSIGHLPRGLSPTGRHRIVYVTYELSGVVKRVLLAPCPNLIGLPSTWNAGVQEWHQAICVAVEKCTGNRPTVTPVEQVQVPSDSPMSTAMLVAPPLVAVIGILVPLLFLYRVAGNAPSSLGAFNPLILGVIVAVIVGGIFWLVMRLKIRRPLIPDGALAEGESPDSVPGKPSVSWPADQSWQSPPAGWGHFIGYLFGISFTSPLAFKLANLSALGFLCFLGFVPVQGAEAFFRFSGFFGFIGLACMIEMAKRQKAAGGGRLRALANVGVVMLVLFAVMIGMWIVGANRAKDLAQQARSAEQQARNRLGAGAGSGLDVIEAEGELAVAEAWGNPTEQAAARVTTATKLLEASEAQYRAGGASGEIVNQARQRKLLAEQELQRLRSSPPPTPIPTPNVPNPLPKAASN